MPRRFRYAGIALLLFINQAALAQDSRAAITGTVVDPQGALISGAQVVALRLATNTDARTTTNNKGVYVFPFLDTGAWSVSVTAPGFKTAVDRSVDLSIGDRRQLDFKLDLGATSEQISISANAELLETGNASRGTIIDAQKIADLPLLGKNLYTLAYQANGVLHINPQGSVTDRPYDNGGMDAIRINGGRAFTNEYLLDGAPNTNVERGNPNSLSFVPPPEAAQELAIQSNNYDAQYGRTGGGVISATLKSGTNKLHGTVYEYWRNKLLNANTFQANRQSQPRGPFLWNQPGATVNGPVYIPKIYDGRNKTFFLFSWEGIYQNIPNNPLFTVPTDANRQGDFSQAHTSAGVPITIYDPLTTQLVGTTYVRQAFPGNVIPANRIDPVAAKILQYFPKANFPADASGFNNYSPTTGLVTKERYNAYTVKFDQVITEAERFSIHYVRNKRFQTGPDYGFPSPVMGPNNFERYNQGANAQLTSVLSPTLVVTTRGGFTQHIFANIMFGGSFDPTQLGFPASQAAQAQGHFFPTVSFTNYTGFGQGGNNSDNSTNWYFNIAANKALGNHSLKFGAEYRVLLDNTPNYSFATFAFSNQFTQRDPINGDAASGNALASFLLGNPASGSSPFNASPAWGNHYMGFYIQDDWRITPKLTVNLGGRWDYDSPLTERYNREDAGFDPTAASPIQAPGLQLKGGLLFTSPENRLPWKRDLNNFQPRIGVAYHFLPNTVFRAGYGLSYVPTFVTGQTQGFSSSTPFIASSDSSNLIPTGRLSNPFPSGILLPTARGAGLATFAGQSISFANPQRTIPFINQFSAGFQQQLPFTVLLDVSFVGSRTYQLGVSKGIDEISADQLALGTTYLNQSVPNPFQGLLPGTNLNGVTTTRRQLLRPYPQFTGITQNEFSIGRGWYNSLQVQVTKRMSHGFHLLVNYTYSETMEAASFLNPQFNLTQLESTRVSEDLPHRLTFLGGYAAPFFKSSHGLAKIFLAGWQAQVIASFSSGRQLNGVDAYSTGVDPLIPTTGRPDGYYFNACSINLLGARQNCATSDQPVAWVQRPSDTLRVAGSRWSQIRELRPGVMDSSMFKTFYPLDKLQLQFRIEAFNTFNTPWFGQANSAFGNARFGLEGNSQTNDPRNVQVALKLTF